MGKYDYIPVIEGRYDGYGRQKYWAKGFKGQGIRIAIIDDFGEEHGAQMASVIPHIAPSAEVVCYDMRGNYYDIDNKIFEAVEDGIDIISISRSVDFDTKPLYDAVKYAYSKNIPIFCSAGNTGESYVDTYDIKRYPAAYPETFSVLSIDNSFVPSKFSSHGTTGTITGLGQNVLVKNSVGEEMLASGTSPVTPACAATLALELCRHKIEHGDMPNIQYIEQFIISHCVDLHGVGRDNMTGYGFFTLDKSELWRVKVMISDANKDGLDERTERIKMLMQSGDSYETAERIVSNDYYIIGYEQLEGKLVPIYGGRKQ